MSQDFLCKRTQNETKYVFESDESLKISIELLKKAFYSHMKYFKSTLEAQKSILDSMWKFSQRFLILTRGCPCVNAYPKEQTKREELEIRNDFNSQTQLLQDSNSELTSALLKLETKCREFDRLLKTIDLTKHKTVHYYIELFADLFKFFKETQNELDSLCGMLAVDDISLIVEYQSLLNSDEMTIDYFETSLFEQSQL